MDDLMEFLFKPLGEQLKEINKGKLSEESYKKVGEDLIENLKGTKCTN
jgi:hypothetical protein